MIHNNIILIYYYTYPYGNNIAKIQYHPIKTIVIHGILKQKDCTDINPKSRTIHNNLIFV